MATALAGLLLATAPGPALAHLVTSGLGPFYNGALHLATSPQDLLGLLALSLLAGPGGAATARRILVVVPAAWLSGIGLGLLNPSLPTSPLVGVLLMMAAGLLVVWDTMLPEWMAPGLGAALGLVNGMDNGVRLAATKAGALVVLGITCGITIFCLLVSSTVLSLRPAWSRIAVRVAGSWVVAVGLLMLGWYWRVGTGSES